MVDLYVYVVIVNALAPNYTFVLGSLIGGIVRVAQGT